MSEYFDDSNFSLSFIEYHSDGLPHIPTWAAKSRKRRSDQDWGLSFVSPSVRSFSISLQTVAQKSEIAFERTPGEKNLPFLLRRRENYRSVSGFHFCTRDRPILAQNFFCIIISFYYYFLFYVLSTKPFSNSSLFIFRVHLPPIHMRQ